MFVSGIELHTFFGVREIVDLIWAVGIICRNTGVIFKYFPLLKDRETVL